MFYSSDGLSCGKEKNNYVEIAIKNLLELKTDDNNEQSKRIDELARAVRHQLNSLFDENKQLQLDNTRLKQTSAMHEGILTELEEENKELKAQKGLENSVNKNVQQMEQTIALLRQELEVRTSEAYAATERIHKLEEELREAIESRKEITPRPSSPLDSSDGIKGAELVEQVIRLERELEDAVFNVEKNATRVRQLEARLEEETSRADSVSEEVLQLNKHIRDLREQELELQAELMDVKNKLPFSGRGNSMFSEFADERVRLEADLRALYKSNEILKRQNYQLTNEVDDARLMARRTNRSAGSVRCRCSETDAELLNLRNQLVGRDQRLSETMQKLIKRVESESKDAMLRSMATSIKREMALVKAERDQLRKERDILTDKNITLETKLVRCQTLETQANDNVQMLTKQLEVMRERAAQELIDDREKPSTFEEKEKQAVNNLAAIVQKSHPQKIPQTPASAGPSRSSSNSHLMTTPLNTSIPCNLMQPQSGRIDTSFSSSMLENSGMVKRPRVCETPSNREDQERDLAERKASSDAVALRRKQRRLEEQARAQAQKTRRPAPVVPVPICEMKLITDTSGQGVIITKAGEQEAKIVRPPFMAPSILAPSITQSNKLDQSIDTNDTMLMFREDKPVHLLTTTADSLPIITTSVLKSEESRSPLNQTNNQSMCMDITTEDDNITMNKTTTTLPAVKEEEKENDSLTLSQGQLQ